MSVIRIQIPEVQPDGIGFSQGILTHEGYGFEQYWDTEEVKSRSEQSGDYAPYRRYLAFGTDQILATDDVFCLPIREMGVSVMGLLLLPTGAQKGQYYRVGLFERFFTSELATECLKNSTDILNEEYFVSKHGCGESAEYTITII